MKLTKETLKSMVDQLIRENIYLSAPQIHQFLRSKEVYVNASLIFTNLEKMSKTGEVYKYKTCNNKVFWSFEKGLNIKAKYKVFELKKSQIRDINTIKDLIKVNSFISIAEIAQALGKSENTIIRLMRLGKVKKNNASLNPNKVKKVKDYF